MKTKLEVVNTVIEAVKFAFIKIPMTLRLGWLGIVIFLAILIGGMMLSFGAAGGLEFVDSLESLEDGNPQAIFGIMSLYGGAIVWSILASVIGLVPFVVVMHRIAAGRIDPPGGMAYFRFGGREIKFVVAHLLIGIISSVVFLVLLTPAFLAFGMGVLSGIPIEAWQLVQTDPDSFEAIVEANVEDGDTMARTGLITGLAFLVGIILYIWFAVRACLFTTAAAVEDSATPFGAFGLTGGNVWRIIAAFLFFVIIVMAIETVIFLGLLLGGGLAVLILSPLLAQGGGAAIAGGVLLVIISIVVYLAVIAFFAALEIAFRSKMYQSLTRDTGGELAEPDAV